MSNVKSKAILDNLLNNIQNAENGKSSSYSILFETPSNEVEFNNIVMFYSKTVTNDWKLLYKIAKQIDPTIATSIVSLMKDYWVDTVTHLKHVNSSEDAFKQDELQKVIYDLNEYVLNDMANYANQLKEKFDKITSMKNLETIRKKTDRMVFQIASQLLNQAVVVFSGKRHKLLTNRDELFEIYKNINNHDYIKLTKDKSSDYEEAVFSNQEQLKQFIGDDKELSDFLEKYVDKANRTVISIADKIIMDIINGRITAIYQINESIEMIEETPLPLYIIFNDFKAKRSAK